MNRHQTTVLNSFWYREDIKKCIIASVRGISEWNKHNIEGKEDKEHYLSSIEKCLKLLEEAYSLSDMLDKLYALDDDVKKERPSHFLAFSALWSWDSGLKYRKLAVEQVIDLTTGIINRYL